MSDNPEDPNHLLEGLEPVTEAEAAAEKPAKKSDLGVRTISAIVMMTVTALAIYQGGWAFALFVAAIATALYYEFWGLARRISEDVVGRLVWMVGGFIYIIAGATALLVLNQFNLILPVLLAVIATDTCAYFAGRSIGGPKIAPSISPSKTWAGLFGGMAGASALLFLLGVFGDAANYSVPEVFAELNIVQAILIGSMVAIVAQSGDFFESWMKRRAGVKDSGRLLPGHGGLFDRVDGLLPVAIFFLLFLILFARINAG